MRRRDMLSAFIVCVTLPGLLYSAYRSRTEARSLKVLRPRFRKRAMRSVQTDLAPGAYLNPRSNKIHFVRTGGFLRDPGRIKVDRLTPFNRWDDVVASHASNPVGAATPSTRADEASPIFEEAALTRLRSGDAAGASALLILAVRNAAPGSVRLYDLLAGISAKSRNDSSLSVVSQMFGKLRGRLKDEVVLARTKKWSTRTGKWYIKWRSGTKLWSGLPM